MLAVRREIDIAENNENKYGIINTVTCHVLCGCVLVHGTPNIRNGLCLHKHTILRMVDEIKIVLLNYV